MGDDPVAENSTENIVRRLFYSGYAKNTTDYTEGVKGLKQLDLPTHCSDGDYGPYIHGLRLETPDGPGRGGRRVSVGMIGSQRVVCRLYTVFSPGSPDLR